MTNEVAPAPRSTTIAPLGGAEFTSAQMEITKVSLLGGASLVVPANVRVEVGGFVLLGGKDIERSPESAASAQIVRVRAFGLIGGTRVRVAG
jgi:hypothetical protein